MAMKPLGPHLLLSAMDVMEDWSFDAILWWFVFGRIWSEWAGTRLGKSMRNIRLMVV